MQTTEKRSHNVDTVIFYRGIEKLANFPLILVVAVHPLDVSQEMTLSSNSLDRGSQETLQDGDPLGH